MTRYNFPSVLYVSVKRDDWANGAHVRHTRCRFTRERPTDRPPFHVGWTSSYGGCCRRSRREPHTPRLWTSLTTTTVSGCPSYASLLIISLHPLVLPPRFVSCLSFLSCRPSLSFFLSLCLYFSLLLLFFSLLSFCLFVFLSLFLLLLFPRYFSHSLRPLRCCMYVYVCVWRVRRRSSAGWIAGRAVASRAAFGVTRDQRCNGANCGVLLNPLFLDTTPSPKMLVKVDWGYGDTLISITVPVLGSGSCLRFRFWSHCRL